MKKVVTFLLALVFIIPCAVCLSACGKDEEPTPEAKIMTVSLNPKLEFVLDTSEKVVSVNALNDDGNHIISIVTDAELTFENKSAESAVELFLDVTKDNGYLITGNEEEITIAISGDADKLLNSVKASADKFFNDHNIDMDVLTEKIEKSDIVNEVKNCMKEYSQTELNNMKESELIDLLKQSRKETKNLLTQELKDAYYNLRIEKINTAELDALLEIVNALPEISNSQLAQVIDTFKSNMETLQDNIEALENAYSTYYLAEDSEYNIAMQNYTYAKDSLLAKRLELGQDGEISDDDLLILADYETLVANAKTALETARTNANTAINAIKLTLEDALTEINSSLGAVKNIIHQLGSNLNDLNNKKEEIKNDFEDMFKEHDNFNSHVGHDKSHWKFETVIVNAQTNLQTAINQASAGDVVKLTSNVVLTEQVEVNKKVVIDLNGFTISNTEDIWDTTNKKWSLISVVEGGDLTIKHGTLQAKENDCYAIDVRNGAKLTIENGRYVGNVHSIYVYEGTAVINGGEFDIQQLSEVTDDSRYTLNCYDANYTNDTANIIVNGGRFANYNPAGSTSEYPTANFLNDGLTTQTMTVGADTWYIVVRQH